jgi:hypothetical protein
MRRIVLITIAVTLPALFAAHALGQDPIVFPAKGQSQDQMAKDKYACYEWAKQETGFDPAQSRPPAPAPPVQSQGPQGERLKGAVRGAAVGAVVGEIADDDAGKGAAAGAAGGVMVGGMRTRQNRRDQAQAQEQQNQQQEAAYDQKRSDYDRAWSACLEGKGYTVK